MKNSTSSDLPAAHESNAFRANPVHAGNPSACGGEEYSLRWQAYLLAREAQAHAQAAYIDAARIHQHTGEQLQQLSATALQSNSRVIELLIESRKLIPQVIANRIQYDISERELHYVLQTKAMHQILVKIMAQCLLDAQTQRYDAIKNAAIASNPGNVLGLQQEEWISEVVAQSDEDFRLGSAVDMFHVMSRVLEELTQAYYFDDATQTQLPPLNPVILEALFASRTAMHDTFESELSRTEDALNALLEQQRETASRQLEIELQHVHASERHSQAAHKLETSLAAKRQADLAFEASAAQWLENPDALPDASAAARQNADGDHPMPSSALPADAAATWQPPGSATASVGTVGSSLSDDDHMLDEVWSFTWTEMLELSSDTEEDSNAAAAAMAAPGNFTTSQPSVTEAAPALPPEPQHSMLMSPMDLAISAGALIAAYLIASQDRSGFHEL
ncbi:hypothetical protein [Comamonas antarctica]|uniref:hypothetical protein n=1 Tax=Comamonas antarctica TaxID=2743470 RepID=UPI0028EBE250|nr:hypothetical protein [Comamonas antarctica]